MSHRSVCNVTYLWHFCIYPSLVDCLLRNVFWVAWCRSAARKFCTWIETSTTVEKALHLLHWTRFLCSVTFCFSAFLFVCHSPVATRNRFKILHHDRRTVWRKCMQETNYSWCWMESDSRELGCLSQLILPCRWLHKLNKPMSSQFSRRSLIRNSCCFNCCWWFYKIIGREWRPSSSC